MYLLEIIDTCYYYTRYHTFSLHMYKANHSVVLYIQIFLFLGIDKKKEVKGLEVVTRDIAKTLPDHLRYCLVA